MQLTILRKVTVFLHLFYIHVVAMQRLEIRFTLAISDYVFELAIAAANVVMYGTLCSIAALRMYELSYSLSFPAGGARFRHGVGWSVFPDSRSCWCKNHLAEGIDLGAKGIALVNRVIF